MSLSWPKETVRKHTAYCIRTTTTTAMQTGGVPAPIVSAVLRHKTGVVTSDHYVHSSKEDMREALAVVGPRVGEARRGPHTEATRGLRVSGRMGYYGGQIMGLVNR